MELGKPKYLKDGRKQVTVTLDETEVMFVVNRNSYIKLGYPHEEIIHSDMIINSAPVTWCSLAQKWVE